MDTKEIIGENLRNVRLQRGWAQSFVANQLQISQRTISRAETGRGLSKSVMKRLCSLYQIPLSYLYKEQHEMNYPSIDIVPDEVALRLLTKNAFIKDIQNETVRRYNDKLTRTATMTRNEVESIIDEYTRGRKTLSVSDVIQCGLLVNQSTIHNIITMPERSEQYFAGCPQ